MSLVESLLLESAIPPPNWLPGRVARLANATAVIGRYLGRGPLGRPRFQSQVLHHGGYPGLGRSEVVGGDEIEAAVGHELTTINPPVLQGWQLALFVPAAFLELAGLVGYQHERVPLVAALDVLLPIGTWLLVVGIAGVGHRMIELAADGVRVRRWLQVWFGRPGQWIGEPADVTAGLVSRYRLRLAGPGGDQVVNILGWPPSACLDVVDELPIWGVAGDAGEHGPWHRTRGGRRGSRRRG